MTFLDLQNKIKQSFKGAGYHLGQRPAADWLLALGVFFLCTILGLFLTVTNRPMVSSGEDLGAVLPAPFSQNLLDRVVERYETKRSEFDSFLKTPPSLVDPSI